MNSLGLIEASNNTSFNSNYGDKYSSIYDEVYREFIPTDNQIEFLASYGGGGALELGVGSGRLAIPLANRGVDVVGIDNSAEMLERLDAQKIINGNKNGGSIVGINISASEATLDKKFSLIYAPFNFFFLVGNSEAKLATMKNAASMLSPGGVLIIEAFMPVEGRRLPDGKYPARFPLRDGGVDIKAITSEYTILTASNYEIETGLWTLSEIILREGCSPKIICSELYCLPAEGFDAIAARASLRLKDRYADWDKTEFSKDSSKHISIYQLDSQ